MTWPDEGHRAYSRPRSRPRRVRFVPQAPPSPVFFNHDPNQFRGRSPCVPDQNFIIKNFERDASPSSTYSSDYDRPARRRRSPSRSRSRPRHHVHVVAQDKMMPRVAWEAEEMRRQIEDLQMTEEHDESERRLLRDIRGEEGTRRVRQELQEGKERESRVELEKKLKEKFERERLEEKMKERQETERREREAKEAVELYKLEEAEKIAKAKKLKEDFEKQYKDRLEQQLANSGLDEKCVTAIMNGGKIRDHIVAREADCFTRMLRRHVSLETLRAFALDFELDISDDETIVVKQHVPEWELKLLGAHTRRVRERRECVVVDSKRYYQHHRREMEAVTRKRKRGKKWLPLPMYLAGFRM